MVVRLAFFSIPQYEFLARHHAHILPILFLTSAVVTSPTALRELQRGSARGHRLEPRQQFVGDESRPLRIRVLVALAVIVGIVAASGIPVVTR